MLWKYDEGHVAEHGHILNVLKLYETIKKALRVMILQRNFVEKSFSIKFDNLSSEIKLSK